MLNKVVSPSDEIELSPKAGFVVKTRLEEADFKSNPPKEKDTKVFLNICSDDNVPLPEVGYEPEVIYPLIIDNKWEIPIITSDSRIDKDKKGQLAYVYDCIINTKAMRWIQIDNQLRDILIEWSLESVELRSDLKLSRDKIATPKLVSKGEVQKLKVLKSNLDINKLNKEFEAKVLQLENDPLSIIEAKRFDEEDGSKDDLNQQVDIFNINGTHNESSTKPLIQEIENMSLSKTNAHNPVLKENSTTKETIKYETKMQKIDLNGYKLKIEITSQNDSSLDYDLELDKPSSTLILKNLNPKYTTKKDYELQLPSVFVEPSIKSFFVKQTLIVFVK